MLNDGGDRVECSFVDKEEREEGKREGTHGEGKRTGEKHTWAHMSMFWKTSRGFKLRYGANELKIHQKIT